MACCKLGSGSRNSLAVFSPCLLVTRVVIFHFHETTRKGWPASTLIIFGWTQLAKFEKVYDSIGTIEWFRSELAQVQWVYDFLVIFPLTIIILTICLCLHQKINIKVQQQTVCSNLIFLERQTEKRKCFILLERQTEKRKCKCDFIFLKP